MKLHVLGTAGYHPNDHRHTAGFMIPEVGVLLDAGTGTFRARDLLETKRLDIFLTHAHLDHIVGLTYLLDVLFEKDVAQVRVHGESAKLKAVNECLFSELLFPVPPPFESCPLDDSQEMELDRDGRLRWFPLRHPGGSIGYRLDWPGHSMAYVTDTTAEPDSNYIQYIQGVDLLIHECNFNDELKDYAIKTGHSHTSTVAHVAAQAGVGTLLLTHFNPLADNENPVSLETAKSVFPNTFLAVDEEVIEF